MKMFLKFVTFSMLLCSSVKGASPQSPQEERGSPAKPSTANSGRNAQENCANAESQPCIQNPLPVIIHLQVPSGTPLRIALDQRTRIRRTNQAVHGKLVDAIYCFDQSVIPAGSIITGRVTSISPVSRARSLLSYLNGNFSPYHAFSLTFDSVTPPAGKPIHLNTAVSPGIAEVIHMDASQAKSKQKNAASRIAQSTKQNAEARAHSTVAQIKSPGRLQRIKKLLLAQLPYRRQYLESGTRFTGSLLDPLDFGQIHRTREQLTAIGSSPAPDSLLHAHLVSEVSSATASRGDAVVAVLTEPLFSSEHLLVLPVGSRLTGEVVRAHHARKFHRNGDLRLIFKTLEPPEGVRLAMQGTLRGAEVDRAAGLQLDDEGGARATDSKKRYLSTALVLGLAGWGVHPEYEHGTVTIADSAGKQAGAGFSGSKFTGAVISMATRTAPVSIAFAAYGVSASVYSNFLSRGRDVVLPKDSQLEISLGNPRGTPNSVKRK